MVCGLCGSRCAAPVDRGEGDGTVTARFSLSPDRAGWWGDLFFSFFFVSLNYALDIARIIVWLSNVMSLNCEVSPT